MIQNLCNMSELSRSELAELLGVDASTISRHKKKGLPVNSDGKTFSGSACVQWVIARVEQAASVDAGETDESRKWLTAFRRERAKSAKIERLVLEGKLIPEAEILPEFIGKVATFRAGLLALSSRLPPILHNKEQLQMHQLIKDEVYNMLTIYSQGGKYCPDTPEVREILSDMKKVMEAKK